MTSFAERFQPPSLSCDSCDLTMSGRDTQTGQSESFFPFFFRININYCFHILFLGSNNRNCAVLLCKSYGVIFDNKRNRSVTYHKIPSDLNVKQAWLQRIRSEENSAFKVWNFFVCL